MEIGIFYRKCKDIIAVVVSFINNTARKMKLKFCNITIAQKLLSSTKCMQQKKENNYVILIKEVKSITSCI